MRSKRVISLILVVVVSVSLLTGCGGRRRSSSAPSDDGGGAVSTGVINTDNIPSMTITFAHMDATMANMQNHGVALYLKDRIETLSGGKMTMDIVGGGALGSASELLEQTIAGQIEMTNAITEANLAVLWADMNVLGVPYAFRSVDQMMDVWDSSFGEELEAGILEHTGARVAFVYQNGGLRNFTNNVKPICTPADMAGMKIRVMDSPAHMALVTALGANPTPVAWTELYTALQTNVVDGQENAVPAILQANLNEVQKYISTDGHVASYDFAMVSNDWYTSLNADAKMVVDQAFTETEAFARRFVSVIADTGLEKLESLGMEVHTTTAEELELFKEATASVKGLIQDTMLDDPTIMDRFDKALEESDARLGYVVS